MADIKDYVVVTTVSNHRMRYVIHKDDLQKMNPEQKVQPIEWAQDAVTCQDVEEFSQDWLGEQIVDTQMMSEEEMLDLFNRDNDYLASWTKEQKLNWVGNLAGGKFYKNEEE